MPLLNWAIFYPKKNRKHVITLSFLDCLLFVFGSFVLRFLDRLFFVFGSFVVCLWFVWSSFLDRLFFVFRSFVLRFWIVCSSFLDRFLHISSFRVKISHSVRKKKMFKINNYEMIRFILYTMSDPEIKNEEKYRTKNKPT